MYLGSQGRSLSNTWLYSHWKLLSSSGLGYGFFVGYFYPIFWVKILLEGQFIQGWCEIAC